MSAAPLWHAYFGLHEAIRWPLIALHLAAFTLSGQRRRTTPDPAAIAGVRRRYRSLLEEDFRDAHEGLYSTSLLFRPTPGVQPREVWRFARDMPRIARRIRQRNFTDLPREAARPFPRYYQRNFHWQTDGYLSEHSARTYDLMVEFLFVGCAEVMRRRVLAEVVRRQAAPGIRLLDLGSGTGSFLLLAASTLPDARLVGVDLSPWYVKEARARAAGHSGARGATVYHQVGNAEKLEFADQSFDQVTSGFLFHELPRSVRRKVLLEAKRVLRPGGRLVVQDSAQPQDAPELVPLLEAFHRDMHEPFFADYLRDDLRELLQEVGFEVDGVQSHFVAKTVSARRP